MSNREIIEWLKKKAEAVPMPGARKMYDAAAKALEAAQPEHGTNLAEVGTDCISRQAAIEALNNIEIPRNASWYQYYQQALTAVDKLPPAQPERTCVNCGRTANNGGWYADGGTRCPIEEHYALPKDGYCHLWEKRNVTDDDYTERREE